MDFKNSIITFVSAYAAMLTIDSSVLPSISGGPLKAVYEFAQLHFHWGANDTVGSEDEIRGRRYPLEIHVVFYKKEYLDFNSALNYPDGLTVLGSLYEVKNDFFLQNFHTTFFCFSDPRRK